MAGASLGQCLIQRRSSRPEPSESHAHARYTFLLNRTFSSLHWFSGPRDRGVDSEPAVATKETRGVLSFRWRSPKEVPHVESCTCYWVGGAAARDGFDDRFLCHDHSAAGEKRDQWPQRRPRLGEVAELLARPLGTPSLQLVLARPLGTRSLWVRAGMLHSESSLRRSNPSP